MKVLVSFTTSRNVKIGLAPRTKKESIVNMALYIKEYKITPNITGYLHQIDLVIPDDLPLSYGKSLQPHTYKVAVSRNLENKLNKKGANNIDVEFL